MSNLIQCAVIDDEPLARECIVNYIGEVEFLQLAGTGTNPVELSRINDQQKVDLLFLDIEMPIMNGIEFLKATSDPPMVILTTAYPSYALEGFQLDVLDYLVKPITFNRFFKAASKAKDYHQLLTASKNKDQSSADTLDYFFIKCESRYEKIWYDEILYVQALQNYVTIHTSKGKYITLLTLKALEEKLDPQGFIRVHKSYVVSISKIDSIDNSEINIRSIRIPVSRNYLPDVIERVVNGKLWKK